MVEVSLLVAEPMLARLIGMGKMMVELCSGIRCCRLYNVEQASCYSCWSRHLPAEMELSVWRYRSWSAEGDCWSTSAASFSAFEAFCSPSAAITWAAAHTGSTLLPFPFHQGDLHAKELD